MLPPAAQRLRSKRGGVMIHPYTHPSVVGRDVVHTIGNALAEVLVDKILSAYLQRLSLGMPFPPRILEIPDPFLFLRVCRYHRLPTFLKRLDLLVDMLKLRIAVGMGTAFLRFPVSLEAIMQVLEQPSDGVVAHLVALLREGLGEMPGAFAGPKQRRLRIPTRRRLQQGLQSLEKARVTLRHSSPSPAHLTEPLPLGIRVLFGI